MELKAKKTQPNEERKLAWSRLGREVFDLLIIGGGVTGCGIARDAALRGLKVALVEKDDFASGTSSKSSKLIHGGLRYLEQGHLRLVFEGTNERALLLRVAPHLVKPLPFLVPAYKGQKNGLLKLDAGLWAYDALSLFSSPKLHRAHFASGILNIEPELRSDDLKGGIVYYDCLTDDARLTLENALDAKSLGALVLNYAKVIQLSQDTKGKISGALVKNVEPDGIDEVQIRAKVVVNATGPWTDEIRSMLGEKRMLKPTKGVHLVVDAARLKINHALLMNAKRDGRVMFAIPFGNRTVLGTTDTFFDESPDHVYTTRDDAEYILETANHYYPSAKLLLSDVISTWAGLRPLVAPNNEALDASDVSREHFLLSRPGFITIAGGKLTTYRRIACDVVDEALKQLGQRIPCDTDERPLPGAKGLWGPPALQSLCDSLHRQGISKELAQYLAETYGSRASSVAFRMTADVSAQTHLRADGPGVMACVDEAIENEMALTLCDVLERRMPLILTDRNQGLEAAPRVAARMAQTLAWNKARVEKEITAYEAKVRSTRLFRQ